MLSFRRFRIVSFVFAAACALAPAANAQQRIQIGELVQRIDRLETEVVRLRVSPGGGSDSARLDLIEQELRRLTGIIERLEYDSRRASSASEKRIDSLEQRLSGLEGGRATAPAAPNPALTTESSFASTVTPPPINLSPGFAPGVAPSQPAPFQPQAVLQPQPQTQFEPIQPQTFAPQPQPGQGSLQSAAALYDEGLRLLNLGEFDRAGAQFEDLVATYPQDPQAGQAQFWLGEMHFKLGRFEQAADAFIFSFRNWPEGPKAPDSLLKLGMTLANIGKTEEACLSFLQVASRYPGASPQLLRRADIESQRYRCG